MAERKTAAERREARERRAAARKAAETRRRREQAAGPKRYEVMVDSYGYDDEVLERGQVIEESETEYPIEHLLNYGVVVEYTGLDVESTTAPLTQEGEIDENQQTIARAGASGAGGQVPDQGAERRGERQEGAKARS